MGPYTVCLVTIDDLDKAAVIARTVVEEKLAACVNIIPGIRSIYSWKGEICDEKELLMIMKTRQKLFADLRSRVKELHPYEVPEIICWTLTDGLPDYLQWIDGVTTRKT